MVALSSIASAVVLCVGFVNAATTTSTTSYESFSPSQSSAISKAWSSWQSQFATGTQVQKINSELATILPIAAYESVINSGIYFGWPSGTISDVFSFATAPPVTLTTTPGWVQSLPAGARSDVLALQTTVIKAEASIARSVLSLNAAPTPGPDVVAVMVAAGAGLVGVAAAVL